MTRKKMLTELAELIEEHSQWVYEEGGFRGDIVPAVMLEQFIVHNLSKQEKQAYDYVLDNFTDGITSAQLSNMYGMSQHHASGLLYMLYKLNLITRLQDPNSVSGTAYLYLSWVARWELK